MKGLSCWNCYGTACSHVEFEGTDPDWMGEMAKQIITLSRQYGSGGREIGERIAKTLGYRYFDRELIRRIAENEGFDLELVDRMSEGFFGRVSTLFSFANSAASKDEDSLPLADRVFLAQMRAIRQVADEGPCVVIGHSADYFLADHPDLLSVFIHADWDSRVTRVMQRNDLDKTAAIARIKKIDRKRAAFYESHTDRSWGETDNYHLALSSSYFGIDQAVEIICSIASA
ncbi:MAG: cytidylate kinase-like family protein [Coriobacteriales bacterium]|nr:cytidylate kinase-like family protein [Coriobacteriales bacterium]